MAWKQLIGSKYIKGLLAILGAIFVGAIGSGVWESILRPLFTSSRDLVLNLVSFGIRSFKDSIYLDIAKGLHENASLELLTLLTFVFLLSWLIFDAFNSLSDIKRERSKLLDRVNNLIQKIDGTDKNSVESEKTPEDIKKSLLEMRQSMEADSFVRLKLLSYFLIISAVTLASFLVVNNVRANYVNSAITHFNQVYSIATPYMDEHQKAQVVASFAQIKNKEDYVAIIQNLEALARSHGQTVPRFTIW